MLTRSRPPAYDRPRLAPTTPARSVTHEDVATHTALILLAHPSLGDDIPAVTFMAVVRATLEASAELARQDGR